ncbi:Annexin A4 [Toxocara canis]|uniref:Annexin n=1 Tax=Toxocara canis TaxID=6265 RepID=A0A0B2W0Q8_TOXCA|nr:Annexin A4 [Toxocara canis]
MILNGYMKTNGTIRPKTNFDDESAAIELESAMRGFGCDRRRVMRVLTGICNAQRQLIRTPYNRKYNKDLCNELKKELSGDFEEVILGLMETPTKYDAYQLHRAVAGLGTAKSVVVEILSSRSNDELHHVKNEYKTQYGRTLERDISDDTSGEFREILLLLLQCKRDEGHMIDNSKAREEARILASGEKVRVRTTFKTALTSENQQQLCALFSEYNKETGRTIEECIEEYFTGDSMELLLALAQCARNKPTFFANLLYASMKAGVGTRDNDLIRLIVSRSEIDLTLIREEFERLYKKPLMRWIEGECSGAYRDSLIAIVNGN